MKVNYYYCHYLHSLCSNADTLLPEITHRGSSKTRISSLSFCLIWQLVPPLWHHASPPPWDQEWGRHSFLLLPPTSPSTLETSAALARVLGKDCSRLRALPPVTPSVPKTVLSPVLSQVLTLSGKAQTTPWEAFPDPKLPRTPHQTRPRSHDHSPSAPHFHVQHLADLNVLVSLSVECLFNCIHESALVYLGLEPCTCTE